MLAIYASEKALRLAERLGEVRAASRAHGIFGRVFGRIGDTVKARENLERAVELARGLRRARDGARAAGARPSPRERRRRLRGAAERLPGGARARRSRSATCPPQIELHAARRAARVLPLRLGRGRALERRERRARRTRGPGRQALPAVRAAGLAALARAATGRTRSSLFTTRIRAGRADRLVGGRLRRAATGSRSRCATRASSRPRTPRSHRHSTSANVPV